MRLDAYLLVLLLAGICSLAGCGGAPSASVLSNAGDGLVATTAIGTVDRIYSGQAAASQAATIDQDRNGNCKLTFTAILTPAGGPPYTMSESFLWAGLNGVGIFYLTTQSISFPDGANSALIDRDDCSGSLQINADGTFSLTLTVTGFRIPTGGSAPSATTTTVIYSGSSIAVSG